MTRLATDLLERTLLSYLITHINNHGEASFGYIHGCADDWQRIYGSIAETVRVKAMQHFYEKYPRFLNVFSSCDSSPSVP